MKSREAELRDLVRDWLRKADLDYDVAARLASDDRFRDIVAFHCQQAVEKYIKSILVRHQVEFRKTHDIERLLHILRGVEPSIARALAEAKWLTPCGVDIRYPGDLPETFPVDDAARLGWHRRCGKPPRRCSPLSSRKKIRRVSIRKNDNIARYDCRNRRRHPAPGASR